jgi:alpha,alpha-trehalase
MIFDAYFSLVPYHEHRTMIRRQLHKMKYYQEKRWLAKMMSDAKKEYLNVWIDTDNSFNHHVEGYGLSRYGDRDIGYAHSSELESGWDFTSRFYNRCSDFLPVDLNALLYKYERDFADAAMILGTKDDIRFWTIRSEERKEEINRLMWNEKTGFFFDYGYGFDRQSDFLSLAGFVPLWAGLATSEQAKKAVQLLKKFETDYGLAITAKESLAKPIDLSKIQKRYHPAMNEILEPKQWDYPNIWAPLEYLAVIGLLRYGFVDDAKRIMEKSVKANAAIFRKYGTFLEKIDGLTGDKTGSYHYELQPGFGWTNGVFHRYIHILDKIQSGEELYHKSGDTQAPYSLTFLH